MTDYQLHPDLVDELNATKAELAGILADLRTLESKWNPGKTQTRLEYAEETVRTMQAERDEARRERGHAWTEIEQLKAALEWLVDEQNGPPLPTHAKNWRKAMREAARLLGRTESERYYSDEEE